MNTCYQVFLSVKLWSALPILDIDYYNILQMSITGDVTVAYLIEPRFAPLSIYNANEGGQATHAVVPKADGTGRC